MPIASACNISFATLSTCFFDSSRGSFYERVAFTALALGSLPTGFVYSRPCGSARGLVVVRFFALRGGGPVASW